MTTERELVIEVGYQVPPNAVYIRTSGDEIRVTIHPKPEAEVLATLRDDIVDAIIDLSDRESASSGDLEDDTESDWDPFVREDESANTPGE